VANDGRVKLHITSACLNVVIMDSRFVMKTLKNVRSTAVLDAMSKRLWKTLAMVDGARDERL
jgi:hypothetical protein